MKSLTATLLVLQYSLALGVTWGDIEPDNDAYAIYDDANVDAQPSDDYYDYANDIATQDVINDPVDYDECIGQLTLFNGNLEAIM